MAILWLWWILTLVPMSGVTSKKFGNRLQDLCRVYRNGEDLFRQELKNDILENIDKVHTKITQQIDDRMDQIELNFQCQIYLSTRSSFCNHLPGECHNGILTIKPERLSDCFDHFECANQKTNGIYTIYPQGYKTEAFCDMENDGGGWTVFLTRQNQEKRENFKRNWNDYKIGFGDPAGEYWMGNEALHLMTKSKKYSFHAKAVTGVGAKYGAGTPRTIWGEWSRFQVASEDQRYQLTISGYNRNSTLLNGDGFGVNDGQFFTTVDRDHDNHAGTNCGDGGGFWYDHCSKIFPTGPHGKIYFQEWSNTDSSSKRASQLQLKLRPVH